MPTYTNSMWMSFLRLSSMNVYDPYFAVCPGDSLRASPPITRSCFTSCSRLPCSCSHTLKIAGCRNFLRCLANVEKEMDATLIEDRTRRTFVGEAPLNKIAPESIKLPAAILPTNGWEYHLRLEIAVMAGLVDHD